MSYPWPRDFEPQFPEVIDNTMRGDFVDCPQKFFQSHILKIAPKGGSIHLVAGAAYAKGLEIIRDLVYGPERVPLEEALLEAIPHVVVEYGDFSVPPGYEHKSCERVIQGLIAYFDKYHPATDHIKPMIGASGKPMVEFSFTFPLQIKHPDTGNPIIYAGRFDMVGIYNNIPFVVDDKTATQLGTSWDRSWRLKAQQTGYAFAAQQHGIPVEGAIIRGTSFLKSGAFGFSEPIIYKAPWNIERWWVQLHRDIQRMINCWKDKSEEHPYGYWDYDLHDACTSYGGCPFAQLCDVSRPEEWVQADYEFRNWNPLDLNPVKRKDVPPSVFES